MRVLLALLLATPVALVPGAAADGCTFASPAYACSFEESSSCSSFTSVGAGLIGVVGVAFAGFDNCTRDNVVATASVSVVFVNLVWADDGCATVVATGGGASLPCVEGAAPPNPGWGRLLP